MPVGTIPSFVNGVIQSQLLDAGQLEELQRLRPAMRDTRALAQELMRRAWLTPFQVNQILQGKASCLNLGPYILLERIGEGGMGQVFKARQKMLNRVVALKVIRKQCLGNPKVLLRFLREIRTAGQLNHPHIVRAYDADQVNGVYYIAMEYIEGADLARLVGEHGPLPVDQACEYIRQVALGLQHAQERGMVHRDIKPANLLVTRAVPSERRHSSGMIQRPLNLPPSPIAGQGSGVMKNAKGGSGMIPRPEAIQNYPWGMVKILDMGLARYTDPFTGHASTHLTQIGSVMGTPEFIAPEQARDSHTSDIRADLYSLGCTFYFLLTGQPPFPKGTLTEKLMQHQFDMAEPVGLARRKQMLAWICEHGLETVDEERLTVPTPVDEVLCRLLAKRPEDRYQTPIELANELQSLLKQMAAGTLPKEEEVDLEVTQHTVPVAAFATPEETGKPLAPTMQEPLVQLACQAPRSSRFTGKPAFLLAGLGALSVILLVTVIAAVLGRGNRTQAGTVDVSPVPLKKSLQKRP